MTSETAQTSRLSAAEIFKRVETGAEEELQRPFRSLAISAVSAGLAMGVSALGVALLLHVLGGDRVGESVAYLAYPLGFLIVIIGRQQLFTENTLFPVALLLVRRRHLARTALLWVVVLAGNLVGTLLFALLMRTSAITPEVASELVTLGVDAGSHGFVTAFWTGVVGGWLIALVAWLVTASTETVAQVVIIFVITYVVGVGHFAHSIAGSAEVLSSVLAGDLPFASYLTWLSGAVLGNAAGGVLIVTLLNYGQVHVVATEPPSP